jgi:cation diffusion facilitator CzcD-associated flavoprotein CzcO
LPCICPLSLLPDHKALDRVLAYWKQIVARHQLHDKIVFHTEFVGSRWDNTTQQHTVTFRNVQTGETFSVVADILISATGALNKPIIPELAGRDKFKGLQWHSSRWNNDVDLSNKRIAIVGNGSSGIQVRLLHFCLRFSSSY